ncbi:MAG: hypothetical protein H0U74_20305 [Bradymonadaceae bacterium]|nr:hypothetical protein [Lujinxingiaceae bacterium]
MELQSSLTRRLLGRREDALRVAQELGLKVTASLAARALGERLPAERGELASWQVDVLAAIIERLCRYDAPDMPAPDQCGALEAALGFISHMPEESRAALSDLLTVFEIGPYVLGPGRERFSALDATSRDAYLASWEGSSLPPRRAAFRALKSACMMGYWTRPQTWSAIGYSIDDNPGVPLHLRSPRSRLS